MDQSQYLSILAGVPAEEIKPFVDDLLKHISRVDVLLNRTGLVMVPVQDTVEGTHFNIGEVLVAESHVKIQANGAEAEGYAMVMGRDLEQSLAVALLDASLQVGFMSDHILAFVSAHGTRQAQADDLLLRQVEATRVEMETF
ncbi:MAG: phosphonate C-P lyase system protein PhnG [Chloroflexota bacterium]